MKKIIIKTLTIFLIFIYIFPIICYADDSDDTESIDINSEIETSVNALTEIKNPDLNSRACVVIDRNTNTILYGKNENTKRKMASTTKIMTAIIIIENCKLNESIEISKKAANTGGSRLGLKTGDKITILDLLYGLMLHSGNDAAVALAEYAGNDISGFAEKMNKKAQELGLKNTHFETPHGLDSDEHYTTAYELALLTNYALNNPTFSKIVGTKNYTITINGYSKDLSNTNELLGNLDGVYGVKTGFTNGANRCLVTACRRGNLDIICVVLGADTKKFRSTDSIKLINYIYQNFKLVNIQEFINKEFEIWKTNNINTFYINKYNYLKNSNFNIEIEPLKYSIIPIRKDFINSLSIKITCKKSFEAPLYGGTNIGNIELISNNSVISNCNIYNSYTIYKNSIFSYTIYFFKNFTNIVANIL